MVHNGGSRASPAHRLRITTRFLLPHPEEEEEEEDLFVFNDDDDAF